MRLCGRGRTGRPDTGRPGQGPARGNQPVDRRGEEGAGVARGGATPRARRRRQRHGPVALGRLLRIGGGPRRQRRRSAARHGDRDARPEVPVGGAADRLGRRRAVAGRGGGGRQGAGAQGRRARPRGRHPDGGGAGRGRAGQSRLRRRVSRASRSGRRPCGPLRQADVPDQFGRGRAPGRAEAGAKGQDQDQGGLGAQSRAVEGGRCLQARQAGQAGATLYRHRRLRIGLRHPGPEG